MAAGLVEILKALQSGDNALRSSAEQQYQAAKTGQPAATVAGLIQVLSTPQQVELVVREQATVLLRQCLSKVTEPTSPWALLGGDAQRAELRAQLMQLMLNEPEDKVRRKIADCVQNLANQLIDIEENARPANCAEWPELMPGLMQLICDPSKTPAMRADALWIVKEIARSMWQCLVASAGQTAQVLTACFADSNEAVKSGASCLLCEIVCQVDSKDERRPFAPFAPELFSTIAQLAGLPDSKHLNAVLKELMTTSDNAEFFKDNVGPHILPVLCPIAKSHADNDTRKLAMEVLISLVEGKPKMMLKAPGCIGAILDVIFAFLMETSDDVNDWATQDEETAEAEENYVFAQEAINRISNAMNQAECFGPVLEMLKTAIQQLFQQPGWKGHVAGLATLAQICEYIDDEATAELMLGVVKGQLQSQHVRARYCAWGAIEQFAQDTSDTIATDKWAAVLLPDFTAAIDDSCVRVVLAAMSAFHHFGEKIERETMESHVQPIMEKLGAKLQSAPSVQREAITSIAVIAGQIEDGFAQYYAPLMPVLKQIISVTLHKPEERTLLGKTFECISLLANVVGREVFKPDAEVIMQAMIQACGAAGLAKDDPVQEYVMAAAERFCSTLKEDFLPFVPALLPGVLAKCALTPKEYDQSKHDDLDDDAQYSLSIVPGENGQVKVLVMNTSELEEVQHALECVQTFIEKLGQHFTPYIGQTAQALLPVFNFDMSEEIRDLAFGTWGHLCNCAKRGGQQATLTELCGELMKRVLPKLEQGGKDLESLKTTADGIKTCVERAGPGILGAMEVKAICQISLKLVGESLARREVAEREKKAVVPGEEEDTKEDDTEEEEALRTAACHMAIALMETHPDHFVVEGLPLFLPLVQRLIQPTACDDDRHMAVLVAAGLCEHLGDRAVAHWAHFLPQVLQNMDHSSPGLKTMACYAASVAAKSPAFAPYAAPTAQKSAEIVVQARSQLKKKSGKALQAAADNSLSVMVQILMHHQSQVAAAEAQLWNTWLTGLPCQVDDQEGIRNNKLLLAFLQQQKAAVVGEGGQNVPRILALLADAYKTDMVDEEISAGIAASILGIDEARLQQCAASLTEKQQKKLLRIRREAQKAGAIA